MQNSKGNLGMKQSVKFWRKLATVKVAELVNWRRVNELLNAGVDDNDLIMCRSRERILCELIAWLKSVPSDYVEVSEVRLMLWHLSHNTPFGALGLGYLVERGV
jgi:hypothetical protein